MEISSLDELRALRETLAQTNAFGVEALSIVAGRADALRLLKFEKLGCDPLDPTESQNLIEQINLQATYEVGADALQFLMEAHPRKRWLFSPGAAGGGHDIVSVDGEVAAEVFAAVSPANNQKLKRDVERVALFGGLFRYVFFRSPVVVKETSVVGDVTVVSFGM